MFSCWWFTWAVKLDKNDVRVSPPFPWDSMQPTLSGVRSNFHASHVSRVFRLLPTTWIHFLDLADLSSYSQLTHFISHKARSAQWEPLDRHPQTTAFVGGDDAQLEHSEDMDGEAHMDDDTRPTKPGCNKRIKVMGAGGSGGVPRADVASHQDQRGASGEMVAEMEAEAAAIQQDMLDGIVGFGCTGYVFSLR